MNDIWLILYLMIWWLGWVFAVGDNGFTIGLQGGIGIVELWDLADWFQNRGFSRISQISRIRVGAFVSLLRIGCFTGFFSAPSVFSVSIRDSETPESRIFTDFTDYADFAEKSRCICITA